MLKIMLISDMEKFLNKVDECEGDVLLHLPDESTCNLKSDNTAAQLAGRMDAIGGQLNAFTTKECTCFYVHALDSHLMEGLDILSDMFFNSNFDEEDVKTERGVVLEEIGMYRDDPADVCNERLSEAVFKGTSLARPILGKKATLERMTGQWLKEYMHSHYRPDRVIISLAGSYDEGVVEEIRRRFSRMEPGKSPRTKKASYTPAITLKRKATEQNQLILAFPSITAGENKRFGMQLLSSILGGGMSSRLFSGGSGEAGTLLLYLHLRLQLRRRGPFLYRHRPEPRDGRAGHLQYSPGH